MYVPNRSNIDRFDLARSAFAVLGRPGGIRGGFVEHSGLHYKRVLHGVDKFAVFVLVYRSGMLC